MEFTLETWCMDLSILRDRMEFTFIGNVVTRRRVMVHGLAQSADQRGSARAGVANRPNGSGDDSDQTRRNVRRLSSEWH